MSYAFIKDCSELLIDDRFQGFFRGKQSNNVMVNVINQSLGRYFDVNFGERGLYMSSINNPKFNEGVHILTTYSGFKTPMASGNSGHDAFTNNFWSFDIRRIKEENFATYSVQKEFKNEGTMKKVCGMEIFGGDRHVKLENRMTLGKKGIMSATSKFIQEDKDGVFEEELEYNQSMLSRIKNLGSNLDGNLIQNFDDFSNFAFRQTLLDASGTQRTTTIDGEEFNDMSESLIFRVLKQSFNPQQEKTSQLSNETSCEDLGQSEQTN